jgi:Rhodopirellula transposase DDE domain
MINDQGWVSVGIDHDTAQFATASIGRWWREMGSGRFPKAAELLITADGGGSNGHRTRLWKVSLQALADDLGLRLSVSHFPPGTSKWNKIEHRLFSFITQNWRGRPLVSHQAIVNLIASTTTKTGLIVKAALDTNHYATEIKVSDEEMAALCLERHEFHGDWNYTISPRPKTTRPKKLVSARQLVRASGSDGSRSRPPGHPKPTFQAANRPSKPRILPRFAHHLPSARRNCKSYFCASP